MLLISQHYWPEEIGSAPYVTELAEWLARRDVPVTVLTARPHYPEFRVRADYRDGGQDEARVGGVRVVRLPTWTPRGGRPLGRLLSEAQLLARALVTLRHGPALAADGRVVSVCPALTSVLAGARAARGGAVHTVLVHDIPSGLALGLGLVRAAPLRRALERIERWAFDRADRLLVLSQDMAQALRARGVRTPIEVLPIWIDPERLFPLPRPAAGPPRVTYSGNFGRKQGLLQVLDMAEVLARRSSRVRITLRGAGTMDDTLRSEARRRGLTGVEFGPLVPPAQLNQSLNAADVHLVPQDPRAAPFAVPSKAFAIMAAGRPFVCTALPDSPLGRLQRETQAFLCAPPDAPEAFADEVERLALDPARQAELGGRGRDWAVKHVSRDAVLSRFDTLTASRPAPTS